MMAHEPRSGEVQVAGSASRRSTHLAPLHRGAEVLLNWLRAGVSCAVLWSSTLGLLHWAAHARARELARSAGEAMLSYARADHIDEPRVLLLNGLSLHMISGTSRDPLGSVLDAFQARCRRVAGSFGEPLARSSMKGPARELLRDGLLDATLRQNDEQSGHVACLDLGSERLEARDLIDRLRAFIATGDVARVGDLRFVWAQRDREQTSYVALWTDGPLPLRSAFPALGDAPGIDLAQLPRPEHSQRVLSAWQQAQAPLLVSYRARGTARELERRYRAQLAALGFTVRSLQPGAGAAHGVLIESTRSAALALFTEDGDGEALVSVSPLR